MVLLAIALILIGVVTAFMGIKLFRVLLPFAGFVAGVFAGFAGVQAVFGSGVVSTTIAVLMAVIVGSIMALMSFLFYNVAIVIMAMLVGVSIMSLFGVAIGLGDAGFIMFLLGVTGAVFGLMIASQTRLAASFVVALTSMLGVGYVLAGVFILAGDISLTTLNEGGIIPAVIENVDQSFLWVFVWIAGAIISMNIQVKSVLQEFLDDQYEYVARV